MLGYICESYWVWLVPPTVHSTSWKFSLHFDHIFRTDWNCLTKFGSSDPNSSRRILTLLYVKFDTSFKFLYIFITTSYLQVSWHDMNLKLTLGSSSKHCKEKSCDHIHDAILWPQLSKSILNVSFQLILYHDICQ